MNDLKLYIDGAAKGNPGPAGIGVVVCRGQEVVNNIKNYIGRTTNNVAEYTALIYALEEALLRKAEKLQIYTDSQLLYRQMKGEYKVKNQNILGLHSQARHLLTGFKEVVINNIPRENNRGADKLANLAIKEALKKR